MYVLWYTNMDIDIITKVLDYGIAIPIAYMLIKYIANKLDRIEQCLRELKDILRK
jgi:hypothetical protein